MTDFPDEIARRRLMREGWSEECLDAERRFGHRAARLYPLVSHKEKDGTITSENAVRTPLGPGTLLQALADSPERPGAMVLHLRPRSVIVERKKDGTETRRPAADFVSIEDVQPYTTGRL